MTGIERVGLVFSSPSKLARSLEERSDWKTPVAILVLAMVAFTLVVFPYQVEYQRQMIEKISKDTGRDFDVEQMLRPTLAKRIFGVVGAVVTTILFAVIAGAILNGVAMLMGKSPGFARMFSLVSYGMIVTMAGNIVKIPLIIAKKSLDVRLSLAAFFPGVSLESPAGILLNSTDIFALWGVAVIAIGFGILGQLGIRKSVATVVAFYIVFVLLQLAASTLMTAATGR